VSRPVTHVVTEAGAAANGSSDELRAREERLRALMVSATAGNETAYRELLQALAAHLRAWFLRRAGRLAADTEDLVQETLLALHNHRHTYDPRRPLTAWAFAIARHKLIDGLRRTRGAAAAAAAAVDADDVASLVGAADHEAADAGRDVMALLATLPDRQRLPIQHVKLEGRSVAEAAALTGMSVPAVKVGIHRGLKALAARLRDGGN
jgi:RNA polymerase sigma-70 factor (ECF subfamily)